MDIGQSVITAGITIGELFVIEAHQVKHRGMQVMDVNRLVLGPESEVIRGAVNLATLDPASREPHREAPMIMVPTIDLAGVGPCLWQLDRGSAAKFSTPVDECFIQ